MILLTAAAIGLAVAANNGAYAPGPVVLVTAATLGALLLLVGRRPRREERLPTGPFAVAGYLVVAAGAAILTPGALYAAGVARGMSRGLMIGASAAALAAAPWSGTPPSARRRRADRCIGLACAAAAGALTAMIVASPHPRIDVWSMYQAAGRALLHGHSPYLAHWTSGLAGEVSNQFTYLPGSAVLLAPFYALFGDVRYGLVAALVVTAWFAYRLGGRWGGVLACAVLVFPGATFAVEQGWNDPLLMAAMAAMVYATRRGRTGWAVLALAVALTCKQYAVLFVPLAAVWAPFGWRRALRAVVGAALFVAPWALAAPGAFYAGVVRYNLDLPPRPDSLSLYALGLRHGVVPGMALVGLGTVGAVLLAAGQVRRRPELFPAAAGVVMAVFDLVNKQSFFNEWELAAVLMVVGTASRVGQGAPLDLPDGPVADRERQHPGGYSPSPSPAAN